jgi:hypothetical protein
MFPMSENDLRVVTARPFYFDHIDQVKRGLRPRAPRPSGPGSPERPAGLRGQHISRLVDNPGQTKSSSQLCIGH